MNEELQRWRRDDEAMVGNSLSVGPASNYSEVHQQGHLRSQHKREPFWYRGPPLNGEQINRMILRPRRDQPSDPAKPVSSSWNVAGGSSSGGNGRKVKEVDGSFQQQPDGGYGPALSGALQERENCQRRALGYRAPHLHGDHIHKRPRRESPSGDAMQTKASWHLAAINFEESGVGLVKHSLQRQSDGGYRPAVSGASEKAGDRQRHGFRHPGPPPNGDQMNQTALHPRRDQRSDDSIQTDATWNMAARSSHQKKEEVEEVLEG